MAQVTTRQELIDYALRRLGAPVTEINIEETQLEDMVDDALQLYKERHYNGSIRTYRKHQITDTDITNEYIPIPDTIDTIYKIFNIQSKSGISSGMFNFKYQLYMNDVFNLAYAGAMSNYYQTMQYLNTLELILNGYDEFEFNTLEDRLYLPSANWGKDILKDDWVTMEVELNLDELTYPEIFNDRWLKRYVTALFRRQWGANIKKYDNVVLPGGVVLSGQSIYDEGNQDVMELEVQLFKEFEKPTGIIIG